VGKDFPRLQDALHASKVGDHIRIFPGNYREKGLIIHRQVFIQGEDWPVLDAQGGESILDIQANGVTVRGMIFRGVGVNYLKEHGGIWITDASDVIIANNRFEHDFFGVYGSHVHKG
jgi:nitrous oxidase accessory protein NosD